MRFSGLDDGNIWGQKKTMHFPLSAAPPDPKTPHPPSIQALLKGTTKSASRMSLQWTVMKAGPCLLG